MKKFLVSLLCVMMVFCMMPTMAFAEDEFDASAITSEAELKAALEDASVAEIVLANSIDLSTAVVVTRDVAIDLNGCTLTVTNDTAGDGVFHVTGGTLTIVDSVGTGVVDGVGNNNYSMAIWADGGNVIINGGTYTNVGAGTDNHYDLIYTKHGGTVEIYGGTFICQTPNWTLNQKDHQNGPETAGGAITVYGGNFYQYNPSVSNSENPIANFVASGCTVTADGDYYTVTALDANAVKTKSELAALVAEGVTSVKLGADIDFDTAFVVTSDLTVDLNGHKLTVENDPSGDGVFWVKNGTLTINDSVGSGIVNGVGKNNYNMAIWAMGQNAKVIINGGNYTNVGAKDSTGDTHFDLIYAKEGALIEINGGTFKAETAKWTLNQHDSTGAVITVKGGKFYGYNPADAYSEPTQPKSFVAEGYISEADGEYYAVREKVNAAITISEDLTFTVGEKKEFTITTTANDDAGEKVYGIATLVDASGADAMGQLQSVEYYEVNNGTWYDLNGAFGPAGSGFTLTDASSTFRVAFKTAGTYTVNYKVVKVAVDEEVVAEGSATVTVNPKQETPTPTPPTGGYYPAPSVKPDVTPDEEAAAPEEEEALSPFEGLEKFKARSKMTTLKGKKAIKLTWNVPEGVDYDGFEVFRSTKRYSGFGTKPFWTTTKTSYTNNKGLEEGKTYYYKVRAFKVVNGEKVYSDWSLKAWRTVE